MTFYRLMPDGTVAPLSYGSLHSFEAGTMTPKSFYRDSAYSVVHSNPIHLDVHGTCPALYMSASDEYRVELRTADGHSATIHSCVRTIGAMAASECRSKEASDKLVASRFAHQNERLTITREQLLKEWNQL